MPTATFSFVNADQDMAENSNQLAPMLFRTTLSLFIMALLYGCQTSHPSAKKTVFIILDGIPADVVEKENTPAIDEIAQAGGYCRAYQGGQAGAYNETPTISAPGYMNILTGVWANKHNVWDNNEQSPNYNYWNIFRIAENADSSLKTAVFSTWLDNRTVLIGEGQPNAGAFRIDYAFDGFEQDTVRFPHDTLAKYILDIDNLVADEAARYITEMGPDLSWVYLEYTDDTGHRYGDSDLFYSSVRDADARVKKIWDAVKKRQSELGEEWLIVVTTDHGRDSLTGQDHGGQSKRERSSWIATNGKNLNKRFSTSELGVIDIAATILKHMGIAAPEAVATEMDGIAFTGDVSFDNMRAWVQGDTLSAQWRPLDNHGNARLSVAFGNDFKTGGTDTYTPLSDAPVSQGEMRIKLNSEQLARFHESKLIKVALDGKFNQANSWVIYKP